MKKFMWLFTLTLLIFGAMIQAQDAPTPRGILLNTTGEGLQIAEQMLPGNTRYIDYNPADPSRYARVDEVGILRFVPQGTAGEGVYTFSPYFDGYTTPSYEENILRVAEAEWAPNGEMFAFRIDSDNERGNDGVWFWQPAIEIPTDPSYQLLRDCPPGCSLVAGGNADRWQSTDMTWSSDNVSILVSLDLLDEERKGITVVQANRDPESTQARTGPNVLRYEYGNWAADGVNIVVSGADPNGALIFGIIERGGNVISTESAAAIGMTRVQDAVQDPTSRQIIMLASEVGGDTPLQIVSDDGTLLSPPIGNSAPDLVRWSADRSAVYVVADGQHYIASTEGTVTNISNLVGDALAVNWAEGQLPADLSFLAVPEPEDTLDIEVAVGQIWLVAVNELAIYENAGTDQNFLGFVVLDEALVIVGGPKEIDGIEWWRVQTLDYNGWIPLRLGNIRTLKPAPEDSATG